MNKIKVLIVALSLVILSGCATTGGGVSGDTTGVNTVSNDTETDNGVLEFGETYTFDDGLSVTVGKPKKTRVSKWERVSGATAYVSISFKVVNKTGKKWDPSLIYSTVQSGDEEAENTYTGSTPETSILNGRQARWSQTFGVKSLKDIIVEVWAGDFDKDSVVWK